MIHCLIAAAEAGMARQPGFFDLSDRYEAFSAAGDLQARRTRGFQCEISPEAEDALMETCQWASSHRKPAMTGKTLPR